MLIFENLGETKTYTLIVDEGELREIDMGLRCAEIEGQQIDEKIGCNLIEQIKKVLTE